MTNNELNAYIKHYIEKDKTGRAIMLTGPWGIGKSYYIRNGLVPFLTKEENGEHPCIVVSLYGLSSLAEVSKAIYLEARLKKLNIKSEAGKAAVLAGKTVLKGVAGFFGVDLSVDANSLQELYNSIDLSGKLIILEDVERTEIDILQILGYVNSLVEQDGVKVLLVTNEDEIIRYEPIEEDSQEKEELALFVEKVTEHKTRKYTQETVRYLEIKEKTVGDTIAFMGDLETAIKQIIHSFENGQLSKYENDKCAEDIIAIMTLMNSCNLRSFIFACQKTVDIYDNYALKGSYSEDFLKTIFYGIVFFSFRLHSGSRIKWEGSKYFSVELGSNIYPLFRLCYDYILEQKTNLTMLPETVEAFNHFRLYDPNKTSSDPDMQIINSFYIHSEEEVISAINHITDRLQDPNDISFYDYGHIAAGLISAKYVLGMNIEKAKNLMINNLKGRSHSLDADRVFWYSVEVKPEEAKEEYLALQAAMYESLMDKDAFIPGFQYLPEQSTFFYDYVVNNKGTIYGCKGFLRFLDVAKIIDMVAASTAAQIFEIRMAFNSLYRIGNIKECLLDDMPAILELIDGLEGIKESDAYDGIQKLQCKWFIENLIEIRDRLA